MTALESIAASINQIDEKKENLKKAFDDLQAHRSLLSPSFNLSWSEIDSHFSSLQSSLFNRLRLLQSATPCPDSERIEAGTAVTIEAPVQWPELRTFCENMDGKGLGKYMIDNWKKRLSINLELPAAIRCSEKPAALVLDAIEGSHHCSPSSSSSAKAVHVRQIFVLLLEALIEINAILTNDLRERARTLAYDWKPNIGIKPSEALVFLLLVVAFELESLFCTDELCDYIFLICKHKQATTICKKIGLDRNRIAVLIQNCLDKGRLLAAISFIYENEMTGEFQPIPILKTSLKNSRLAAQRVCAQGNYSLEAQNKATDKELKALRAVIKVVKEKNLELESFEEKLEESVKELEDHKAQMRLATKFVSPANLRRKQKRVDNRRSRVANGATRDYNSRIPPLSLQQPLLPDPNQNLQVNPYVQPVFYEQQTGHGGYGMPPYYPL